MSLKSVPYIIKSCKGTKKLNNVLFRSGYPDIFLLPSAFTETNIYYLFNKYINQPYDLIIYFYISVSAEKQCLSNKLLSNLLKWNKIQREVASHLFSHKWNFQ